MTTTPQNLHDACVNFLGGGGSSVEFVWIVQQGLELNRGACENALLEGCDVSRPTVRRWASGQNVPHVSAWKTVVRIVHLVAMEACR